MLSEEPIIPFSSLPSPGSFLLSFSRGRLLPTQFAQGQSPRILEYRSVVEGDNTVARRALWRWRLLQRELSVSGQCSRTGNSGEPIFPSSPGKAATAFG